MLDIFSRKVVGWMLAERESGTLASVFIADCCAREGVTPGSLTIHSDRGTAMMSKPVVGLLSTLDVHKTVSRPRVSNDNPYSEAQFKTMKYRPNFPRKFGSMQDARSTLLPFFAWYNTEHRHSSIAYLTPESVHSGRSGEILAARQVVLANAYAANPERFVRGMPRPRQVPAAAWINPPHTSTEVQTLQRALAAGEEEVMMTHGAKAA